MSRPTASVSTSWVDPTMETRCLELATALTFWLLFFFVFTEGADRGDVLRPGRQHAAGRHRSGARGARLHGAGAAVGRRRHLHRRLHRRLPRHRQGTLEKGTSTVSRSSATGPLPSLTWSDAVAAGMFVNHSGHGNCFF